MLANSFLFTHSADEEKHFFIWTCANVMSNIRSFLRFGFHQLLRKISGSASKVFTSHFVFLVKCGFIRAFSQTKQLFVLLEIKSMRV